MSGQKWTMEELETIRRLYPTEKWPVLLKALPGRTKAAIRCQVISLNIRRARNSRTPWKGSELVALRKLYPSAKWTQIDAALSPHTRGSIAHKARSLGLRRDGATKQSRYSIIQKLRHRRRELNIPQSHLAGQIGVHTVQLAKWERGEQMPRLRGLFDWVDALGYKLELLKP